LKRWPPVLWLVVAVAAASLAVGFWIGRSRTPATEPAALSSQSNPMGAQPSRPPAGQGGLRPQIRQAIERAPVHGPEDVDRYLDALEAQARRQGQVTALEVEPGVAMARRFYPTEPEKVASFTSRMLRVQTELQDAAPQATDPAEARKRLAELTAQIPRAPNEGQRQELIRTYLDLARQLPPEEHPELIQKLNQVAGTTGSKSDARAADSLWAAIQNEADEENKQDLIRDYLTLIAKLDENERARRLGELNTRYGIRSNAPPPH